MRLVWLDSVPPALSADEASNAYDGYCLLKTGADRWGESWPVVLRAFGDADYRPALYAYLTVPFQALLGPALIVTASRLPAALIGLLTVWCLYSFARRNLGERTALAAALLLALCPWHVVMSRLAHESAITPLFPVLILLLLERGGVGLRGGVPGPLRWPWMMAAGASVGLSQYSYASMRLFAPAFLLGIAIICGSSLRQQLRQRSGRWALAAAVLAAGAVAGPMIHATITDWQQVNARAEMESILHQSADLGAALGLIARQYAAHFGLDWLFVTGHPYVDMSPRGCGQLNWYSLPLLVTGVVALVRSRAENRVWAIILLWLVLYPVASATTKGGVNAARAACGVAVFPLIGAIGWSALAARWRRSRWPAGLFAGLAAVIVTVLGGRFAYLYMVDYPRDPEVQARYQVEFRLAMDYLRQRRDAFDHVFVSDVRSMSRDWHTSEAYIFPLVYLPIEPADFQKARKDEFSPPDRIGFHYIAHFGDFTFTINRQLLSDYAVVFGGGKVLLMARPGEVLGGRLEYAVNRPPAAGQQSPVPCLELRVADLGIQIPRAVWDQP